MKKRLFTLALAVLMLTALFAGCSSGNTPAATAAAATTAESDETALRVFSIPPRQKPSVRRLYGLIRRIVRRGGFPAWFSCVLYYVT